MKRVLIVFDLTLLFLLPTSARADYNANIMGVVTDVLTYSYSSQILVRISTQPTSHPECTLLDYFVIPENIDKDIRQQLLSRLLTAYATGKPTNIGYDMQSGCMNGRMLIYRVG